MASPSGFKDSSLFQAEIRIGISGWVYAPWRNTFFPKDLERRKELAYASRKLRSIEVNGTFYALQTPKTFRSWYDQTPADFCFAIKGPRFITHIRRLKEVRGPLANFFASGVLGLKEKLGPFLWQLPPSLAFEFETLRAFVRLLPRSMQAAATLAKDHDSHFKGQVWTEIEGDQPLRHAIEVRHASFKTPEFIRLLLSEGIALVVADTAGKWPQMEDLTTDFVYVRLHGAEQLYVSGYTAKGLAAWALKITAWAAGKDASRKYVIVGETLNQMPRDVYVYFDNDVKTRSPYDAMTLANRLGLGEAPDEAPPIGSILEEPRTNWAGVRPETEKMRVRSKRSQAPKRKKTSPRVVGSRQF